MGFEIRPHGATLEFAEGHALHGASVQVSLDITLEEHQAMSAKVRAGDGDAVVEAFARALQSWDLEWDGAPVPCTPEGLQSLPSWVADALAEAWLSARAGLPFVISGRTAPGAPAA